MNVTERQRIIAEDRRIAALPKSEHFCIRPGCAECNENTRVQMARNRVAAHS